MAYTALPESLMPAVILTTQGQSVQIEQMEPPVLGSLLDYHTAGEISDASADRSVKRHLSF